jgi:parvulin-like peptidyl-prolyl isomerase
MRHFLQSINGVFGEMIHSSYRVSAWEQCNRWLFAGLLLVALLKPGAGDVVWAQTDQIVDGIAAIVNDEIVTISEVRETMALELESMRQRYSERALQSQAKELYRRTLMNLVGLRLQLERARKLNLQVNDEDVTYHIEALKKQNQISNEQLEQMLQSRGLTLEIYREQVREGLLVAKVVNAEVRSRLIVLDTELQEVYRQRQERYRVPGELTVSHILFLVSPQASDQEVEQARQKAAEVLQKLRAGGNFAALARQYSDGPSADQAGLLGTFRAGELLPGFEEVAAKLQPGEISDVVRTRVGFHIIRVESRQDGGHQPFEAVREEIKTELLQTKTEQKYQEWLESLRQSAYVKVLYEG